MRPTPNGFLTCVHCHGTGFIQVDGVTHPCGGHRFEITTRNLDEIVWEHPKAGCLLHVERLDQALWHVGVKGLDIFQLTTMKGRVEIGGAYEGGLTGAYIPVDPL